MVKNFTTLALGCLLLGGTVFAADASAVNLPLNGKDLSKIENRKMMKQQRAQNHKAVVTRAGAEDYTTIDNPQGEYKYYYKNAVSYDSWYGDVDIVDEPSVIVFGENNEVYFQDLYTLWYAGTFTKGTYENGVITVNLPQTVMYWPEYGYGIELNLLEDVDGDLLIAENNTLTYLVDEETGVITLDLPGEPYQFMVGVTYTDDQSVDGVEFTQEYTPVTDLNINTIPAELVETEYMFVSGNYGKPVYLAKDDNYLYIKGISDYAPQGVIVATLNGNAASISQYQVVGLFSGYFLSTVCCVYNNGYDLTPETTVFGLNIDWDNNVITPADEGLYLGFSADPSDPNYLVEAYNAFKIFIQEDMNGTPANPNGLFTDDQYLDETGFVYFGFDLPNIATNGNVLNTANLSYRIFVDEELMEFEPTQDEYFGLPEATTEIPYDFFNGYDFNMYSNTLKLVGLYMEGFTTLGVQLVYDNEGVVTESAIVELNVETGEETVGIEDINFAPEVNAVYYNLNGMKIANPDKGIYIKKSTLSDGKVIVKKIVRK